MNKPTRILFLIIAAALLIAGCNRTQNNPSTTTSAPPPAAQPAATPAQPAMPAQPAAPASTASTDSSAATIEQNQKLSAVDWAMKQDEIKNDPSGQWAINATASSSYGDAKGTAAWSPMQVTGQPNVEHYGDDGRAWAPKTEDGGIEWVDLTYAKPVNASEVRIRESCGSGAVVRLELFDDQGNPHKVWQGDDPTKDLNYFIIKFPPTSYKTNHLKITLATNAVPGWNEIDAVQLIGK
ncbi:MAG TPA: hypothetical protein VFA71_14950 [Terriglobales bacterium]|nr:hypothetical protein [Terriglobales bacterium]